MNKFTELMRDWLTCHAQYKSIKVMTYNFCNDAKLDEDWKLAVVGRLASYLSIFVVSQRAHTSGLSEMMVLEALRRVSYGQLADYVLRDVLNERCKAK